MISVGEGKLNHNYCGIDYLKIFMAIFVVAIHTNPFAQTNSQIIINCYDTIVSCAVPFFFIASGFLLAHKEAVHPAEMSNVIYKQTIRIVRMYFIWSLIYLPLAIYAYTFIYHSGIIKSVLSYIRNFLLVGEHYDSWQLWYLLSTVYALVFLNLFVKRFSLYKSSLILWLISIALWLIVEKLQQDSSNMIVINIQQFIGATIGSNRILQGGICIPLGVFAQYCKKKNVFLRWYPLLALVMGGVAIFEIYMDSNFLMSAILSFGMLIFATNVKCTHEFISNFLRFSSLVIYTTHMYFVFIGETLLFTTQSSYIVFLFAVVATIILSIVLWSQRSKARWIRFLWY